MKLADKVNGLEIREVSEDVEIQVAMGKVASQLKSLEKKVKGKEADVYSYLASYLTNEKRAVIKGVKQE